MSSINRVLRNLASSKEQSSHHLSAAAADSVYDKLRMFNGQAAAAAGWAWYGKSNFFFHNRLKFLPLICVHIVQIQWPRILLLPSTWCKLQVLTGLTYSVSSFFVIVLLQNVEILGHCIWKDIQAFLINILSFANLQIFHPFLFVFFVGAATGGPTSHLGLGGHHNPTPHPALSTPHQFGSSVTSNGGPGSTGEREPVVDDKKHLSGRRFLLFSCHFGYFLALFDDFWLLASGRGQKTFLR